MHSAARIVNNGRLAVRRAVFSSASCSSPPLSFGPCAVTRGVTSRASFRLTSRTFLTATAPLRDSDSDFEPQRKAPTEDEQIQEMIAGHVKDNHVMLYMKGSPSAPQCGFSAKTVQILKDLEIDFASVNVLQYNEIREGVKKFAGWPTIPQLYVNGEFVGGCDIVTEMYESGELQDLVKEAKAAD